MKTLIRAGFLYPVVGKPVPDGAVAISDGVIEKVAVSAEFTGNSFDSVIDLPDHLLLPGFVNTHSHLQLAGARGKISRGGSFSDWVRQVIRFSEQATATDQSEAAQGAIDEQIMSGVTAVADIVSDSRFAKELLASPMRSVVFIEAIAPLEPDADKELERVEQQVKRITDMGGRPGVSPHSPYTVSQKLFMRLKTLSKKMNLPFCVHLAETAQEDAFIREGSGDFRELLKSRGLLPDGYTGSGKSPVALLRDFGVLDGCLAVHLNEIDGGDILLLAKDKAAPVFCPGSSRWFGRNSVMPLSELINAGLKPSIGTDSAASNDSLSMLDEMRQVRRYFPQLGKDTIIEMATINGAEHLGLNCGAISQGMWADIIGFRWDRASNPADCLFEAKKADFVMIGGITINPPDGIK